MTTPSPGSPAEVLVIKAALAIREVRVTKEASNRNHQAEVDNKSSHQQTVEVLIRDFLMEQQRQVNQVDKIFKVQLRNVNR
ncbi:MAG: hypothetical protein HFH82_15265 [Lachnospiraceae bacterium]|nr:hypothetical protein [Lachnospiraceae bacterium]